MSAQASIFDPYAYAASVSPEATPTAKITDDSKFNPYAYAQTYKGQQDNTSYNPATGKTGIFDYGLGTAKIPGWAERGLEGIGKSFVDIGRGAAERVGLESKSQIAAARARDAPLMNTAAGKVGDVAGSIAVTAPAMLIPGVNTVAGGAIAGGALGFLQPTVKGENVAKNTAFGALSGGIGTGVGNKIADVTGGLLVSRAAAAERQAAINAERDSVLSAGREVGLKVPPTAVKPSLLNTAAESVSGKAATRQSLQASNQKVFNSLVSKDLGLPEDQPITKEALQSVRTQAGKAYEAVKGVGVIPSDQQYIDDLKSVVSKSTALDSAYPGIGSMANQKVQDLVKAAAVASHDSSAAVDLTKLLRNQAGSNFKAAFRTGDPERLELAHAQQGVSNAIEDLIGRHLESIDQPGLAQDWQQARTTIAKSYQAQTALKGSNVDALRLARQSTNKPMSGGMGLISKFASHFPEVSVVPKSGPGVSKLAFFSGLGEFGAAGYLHSPALAGTAAATMVAPYAVRKGITSGIGQALLATPKYPGFSGALGDLALKGLNLGGRAGLLAAPLKLNPYSNALLPE